MGDVHVYVIAAEELAVKIGLATRPMERLRALQTAHHRPLSLCYSIACEEDRAGVIERRAHRLLKDKRLQGEWFGVSPLVAQEAILSAVKLVAQEGIPVKAAAPAPELKVMDRPRVGVQVNLSAEESPRILSEYDMELAKTFLQMSEQREAIAHDCISLHIDPASMRETLAFWWSGWDWNDALSRLSAVCLDLSEFNAGRWPEHNRRYSRSNIFRFTWADGNTSSVKRLSIQLWHEAKLAVRETSIDRLLMTMVEQGAPLPWGGFCKADNRKQKDAAA